MAAVVKTRYNPHIKAVYVQLLAQGKSKMPSLGAAMRKLVYLRLGVLICTSKHQLVTKFSIQLIHKPLQFFRQWRTQLHSLSRQWVGEGNAARMQEHAL